MADCLWTYGADDESVATVGELEEGRDEVLRNPNNKQPLSRLEVHLESQAERSRACVVTKLKAE